MADKPGGPGGGSSGGSGSAPANNPFSNFTGGFKSSGSYGAAPDDYSKKAAAALNPDSSEMPGSSSSLMPEAGKPAAEGEDTLMKGNPFSRTAKENDPDKFKGDWRKRLGEEKTTSGNYQQKRQDQINKAAAEDMKKAAADKERNEKAQAVKAEKRRLAEQAKKAQQTGRASYLKSQIAGWTSALQSMGPDERARTQGTIDALKRELFSMPEEFWR